MGQGGQGATGLCRGERANGVKLRVKVWRGGAERLRSKSGGVWWSGVAWGRVGREVNMADGGVSTGLVLGVGRGYVWRVGQRE